MIRDTVRIKLKHNNLSDFRIQFGNSATAGMLFSAIPLTYIPGFIGMNAGTVAAVSVAIIGELDRRWRDNVAKTEHFGLQLVGFFAGAATFVALAATTNSFVYDQAFPGERARNRTQPTSTEASCNQKILEAEIEKLEAAGFKVTLDCK